MADELRIRMYRVGFGDFFLVTIPSDDGPQHIVVDCGVVTGTTGKGDIHTIKPAIEHMKKTVDDEGGRIALIIVTHRHKDHIIGFSRKAEVWKTFDDKVDAIWMPLWEAENEKAKGFQLELQEIATNIGAIALSFGADNENFDEILDYMENATGFGIKGKAKEEGPGGGTNAKSLALLKTGLGVDPQYLGRGDKAKLPKGLVKAGLTAEILSPPPIDESAFLKLEDLKEGTGQYLDADGAPIEKSKGHAPLFEKHSTDPIGYPAARLFHTQSAEAMKAMVKGVVPSTLAAAAKAVEGILNNQSLVVYFTWKNRKLLFAGDAQAGNWESWLYDLEKPIKDPTGQKLTKRAKELLAGLDFYKVGHHGSTNATPIPVVEGLPEGVVSMCSTQANTYGSKANHSEVPRDPLVKELVKKGTFVRSDQFPAKLEKETIAAADGTKPSKPTSKVGRWDVGDYWVDFFLSPD